MGVSSSPPQLLLVVDDSQWRLELLDVLQQDGFAVVDLANATRVRDLLPPAAGQLPFELIILNTPCERANLECSVGLIQSYRRKDPATPLLLLPNQADEAQRVALLEAGADDILVNPFGVREFTARCRALLRRSKRRQLSSGLARRLGVLQVGPIALYRQECRATLNGIDVVLSPKEFRLLECFMLQPGRALSREELLEQVWGPDFNGDMKSIDVHILWLRRKLEPDHPKPKLFVTVRGIGYRLDPPRDGALPLGC
jgi:two-component system phosphate regulon response regulator PhoB